jgi:HEAT repeat protein
MRFLTPTLVFTTVLAASTATLAQQPEVIHAQLTTQAADHGLGAALDGLKRQNTPLWAGYTIPVADKFSSGWRTTHVVYLEGEHESNGDDSEITTHSFDHAEILLRIDNGAITKVRVESPNRQLDAGGLRFVWLTGVDAEDSVHTLATLATQEDVRHLRDSAVFAISIHQTPAAIQALIGLTAPANTLELREKAAFWLANQRGHEGFAVIQRLAHDDADPKFREKLTFDLTLSKDPAALTELIRMAHEDAAPQVRKQAQFWMAQKGGKVVAGDLRNAAENDPDTQVRKSAVFALSRLPGDEAATQLIQVADTSKDPAVRKQAVFWLGQSSDPRALDYLTKLLKQ